jgi:hypothetical protein
METYDLNSSSKFINDYYKRQAEGQQAGGSLPVFEGSTMQYGSGIGGIFSKLMRGVVPMLKEGAKYAGKQLINTGLNIANDVVQGERFTNAAKANLKTGSKQLLSDLTDAFNSPKTSSKRGVSKRKLNKKSNIKTKRRRVGKDIFS